LADVVHDPYCWAEYYSGQIFREGNPAPCPPGYHPIHYVILGNAPHERNMVGIADAEKLAQYGKVVYHWPTKRPKHKAEEVSVYAVPSGP
jgi:hypothetical protein